jgi:polyphosphate kinase
MQLEPIFYNRDLSWLTFNERLLIEAANESVPLMERLRFLTIYSSNSDEFYRVRMPALMALHQLSEAADVAAAENVLPAVQDTINRQLEKFGDILRNQLLPAFKQQGIQLYYNEAVPAALSPAITNYFYSQVLSFIQPVWLKKVPGKKVFFPQSNELYLLVSLSSAGGERQQAVVNIPANMLPRFWSSSGDGILHIIFLDDIIRQNLQLVFANHKVEGAYSIKITRDADLNLKDEFEGDLAEKIEMQLATRDDGLATRFLYDPAMPQEILDFLAGYWQLAPHSVVKGGRYHHLKDLASLPGTGRPEMNYETWPRSEPKRINPGQPLFDNIWQHDIVIHPPYQPYDTVLRFFNEAAIDTAVEFVAVTLYRVANDSRIANALISAARNGKEVTVFVELKARFDEANNLRWAKQMKAAGVRIVYSIPKLKVHAKIAMVKRRENGRSRSYGLLATGNFNESTARFYTDHILLTANPGLLQELELLLLFLRNRQSPKKFPQLQFDNLLVAQFGLQQKFMALIDREIQHAAAGRAAGIIIKLNNLEEEKMIQKLYEASQAGVKVQLIIRGICCLVPGVQGLSENITIRRIIDRYLEHGRIFIFENGGAEEMFMGSADWMNRNIYRRIEVCFPVIDAGIRSEIKHLVQLQLNDNVKAVALNSNLENVLLPAGGEEAIRSQLAIAGFLHQQG